MRMINSRSKPSKVSIHKTLPLSTSLTSSMTKRFRKTWTTKGRSVAGSSHKRQVCILVTMKYRTRRKTWETSYRTRSRRSRTGSTLTMKCPISLRCTSLKWSLGTRSTTWMPSSQSVSTGLHRVSKTSSTTVSQKQESISTLRMPSSVRRRKPTNSLPQRWIVSTKSTNRCSPKRLPIIPKSQSTPKCNMCHPCLRIISSSRTYLKSMTLSSRKTLKQTNNNSSTITNNNSNIHPCKGTQAPHREELALRNKSRLLRTRRIVTSFSFRWWRLTRWTGR